MGFQKVGLKGVDVSLTRDLFYTLLRDALIRCDVLSLLVFVLISR